MLPHDRIAYAALARWNRLARQAAVPEPTLREIGDRHRQIRERVGKAGRAGTFNTHR